MLMIENIQFRCTSSSFQELIRKDIKELHQNNKILVLGDKSTNIYKMEKEEYEELIFENVTKT